MTPEERAARVENCKHGLLPNWCLPCLNAELDRVTAERDASREIAGYEMKGRMDRDDLLLERDVQCRQLLRERDAAQARAEKAEAERDDAEKRSAFHDLQAQRVMRERGAALAQVKQLMDGMEAAWGVIANAGGGNWDSQGPEWKAAAERWRDEHWHSALKRHVPLAATEPKP